MDADRLSDLRCCQQLSQFRAQAAVWQLLLLIDDPFCIQNQQTQVIVPDLLLKIIHSLNIRNAAEIFTHDMDLFRIASVMLHCHGSPVHIILIREIIADDLNMPCIQKHAQGKLKILSDTDRIRAKLQIFLDQFCPHQLGNTVRL